MKCLNKLTFEKFQNFIVNDLEISYWNIFEGDLLRRAESIKNTKYFQILKKKSQCQQINASDTEIVTWIDTLRLIYETIKELPQKILQELIIIQEYLMPFNLQRADYLLVYRNRILIVEFSFEKYDDCEKPDNYGKSKNDGKPANYGSKVQQVLGYKELLQDLLPNYIDVGTYVYKYKAEIKNYLVTKINKFTNKDEPINNERKFACKHYIQRFFEKEPIEINKKEIAINELNQIAIYEENRIQEAQKDREINKQINILIKKYLRVKEKFNKYLIVFENEYYFYVFDEDVEKVSKLLHTYNIKRAMFEGTIHQYLKINIRNKEYLKQCVKSIWVKIKE